MRSPELEPASSALLDRIEELERRLARLEIGLARHHDEPAPAPVGVTPPAAPAPGRPGAPRPRAEDLEFQMGRKAFAVAGVVILAAGVALLLSLPYPRWPAALPALGGFAVAGFAFAFGRGSALLPLAVRGAAMALLCFAALRLFFFGPTPALALESAWGRAVLLAVPVVNLTLALHRRSPGLTALALATGGVTALAAGTAGFTLPLLVALGAISVAASVRRRWPNLIVFATPLLLLAYAWWALGRPGLGHGLQLVRAPALAPVAVLALSALFALGSLWRAGGEADDATGNVGAVLNCGLGFGVFLLHAAAAFPQRAVAGQAVAAGMFLALAAAFFHRRGSRSSTFLYAMTGYAALTWAIVKAAAMPGVFVWLSLQSVLVVATAIWFRSRFIVVANFLIYVAIVLAYVALAERESGISIGFGVVALVSARILGWQQRRLELQTDRMRNAYLVGAFIVFPYALAHLVLAKLLALSWLALAAAYYALSLAGGNRKYRWMGHGTLVLTTLQVALAATRNLDPRYRVLSCLALGVVLLLVSFAFTRTGPHPPAPRGGEPQPPPPRQP